MAHAVVPSPIRLTDFAPTPLVALLPRYPTAVGSVVYFVADEIVNNERLSWLWRTDGSEEGTTRVKSFPSVEHLVSANGLLFFIVGESQGAALWRSGTAAGTLRVTDPAAGPHPRPSPFAGTDHRAFFVGHPPDDYYDAEIWTTEGEPEEPSAWPTWDRFTSPSWSPSETPWSSTSMVMDRRSCGRATAAPRGRCRSTRRSRTIRRQDASSRWWASIDRAIGHASGNGPDDAPGTPKVPCTIGFTNVVTWADPERQVAAALMTSGKPILYLGLYNVFDVLRQIGLACPKVRTLGGLLATPSE